MKKATWRRQRTQMSTKEVIERWILLQEGCRQDVVGFWGGPQAPHVDPESADTFSSGRNSFAFRP